MDFQVSYADDNIFKDINLLDHFPSELPDGTKIKPREIQTRVLSQIQKELTGNPLKKFFIVEAPVGCHAKGTLVLMYDGSLKKVENVSVGDLLMGPDSKPRQVLELYKGQEKMYRVVPKKGEPWVCNESHILSLQYTSTSDVSDVINVSVRDYLTRSKNFQETYKLYRASVDFPDKEVPIDPYLLGLFLGCGEGQQVRVSSVHEEIHEEFQKNFPLFYNKEVTPSGLITVEYDTTKKDAHKIFEPFIAKKHIPLAYKANSREKRLKLLEGLIDSKAYYISNTYQITIKEDYFAEDVKYLCRSLGLACYGNKKTINNNIYNFLVISGDLSVLDLKVKSKQATERKQIKSVLRTGFTLEELGVDDYFGFELTGDHLYLLGDFTVTHNTGKSFMAMTCAKAGGSSYVTTANKVLQDQYKAEFDFLEDVRGRGNYKCNVHSTSKKQYNCANSPCRTNSKFRKECTKNKACEYHAKVQKAFFEADYTLLNQAAFLYNVDADVYRGEGAYFQHPRKFLVIDEAHSLPEAITDLVEVSVSKTIFRKAKLPEPHSIPNFLKVRDGNVVADVEDYLDFLRDLKSSLPDFDEDPKAIDNYAKEDVEEIEKTSKRLSTMLGDIESEMHNWVCVINDGEHIMPKLKDTVEIRKVAFKPINVSDYARKFFRVADKVLILSATIIDFKTYMDLLGLSEEETVIIKEDSPFPVANRPIYCGNAVAHLTNKTYDRAIVMICEEICKIMRYYPNYKGIIHAHTYTNANKIRDYIYGKGLGDRLIYPQTAFEQKECLQLHRQSTNTFLISPSMTEGVDLKDDLSRIQIIPKIPYPYFGDPLLRKRIELYPGYYKMKTIITLMQAYGRSIRSETDWALTFILDSQFESLLFGNYNSAGVWNILPEWLQKAFSRDKFSFEGVHQ